IGVRTPAKTVRTTTTSTAFVLRPRAYSFAVSELEVMPSGIRLQRASYLGWIKERFWRQDWSSPIRFFVLALPLLFVNRGRGLYIYGERIGSRPYLVIHVECALPVLSCLSRPVTNGGDRGL